MPAPRIIKKYPNRRLYDFEQRGYITVSDLRKLVLKRIKFKVIDQLNDRDVTDVVLLQAILEQHLAGKPVLSRSVLERALRSRRK